jgi:CxxC motif-containing protein
MIKREIICTGCPLGCHMKITVSPDGNIGKLSGNQCQQGQKYAQNEFKNPVRILTSTVLTEGSRRSLLPVRTDRAVPKVTLKQINRYIAQIRIQPPVKSGQEIVHNILGSGANLIATSDLLVDS